MQRSITQTMLTTCLARQSSDDEASGQGASCIRPKNAVHTAGASRPASTLPAEVRRCLNSYFQQKRKLAKALPHTAAADG